jgi:8-oxo-dGTP pyrophosphatase MutT (NUDIX family)
MYGFDIDKQAERAFVVEHMSPVPHEMQFERHFCVTTYVQDPCSGKYLFIKHKKLGKWLPPGGHVEANELPDQAAIRECKEETGIDIELKGERGPVETALVRPFGIQRNVIKVGQHEHMDLIYLAIALNGTEIINNEVETNGAQWLSVDELSSGKFETFPEVVQWVKYFETQKK